MQVQSTLPDHAADLHSAAQLDFGFDEASPASGFWMHLTRWQVIFLAKIFEIGMIAATALAVGAANSDLASPAASRYVAGSLIIAVTCYVSFLNARLYDINLLIDSARVMKKLSICWTVVFCAAAAMMALAHSPGLFSRQWFFEFYAGGIVALGFERWSMERLVRAWVAQGHFTKAVAIVGANELAVQLIAALRGNANGIRVIGVFDDRRGEAAGRISRINRLGTIADLLEFGKSHTVDLVVVTLPIAASERIQLVIKKLREQPFDIRILPGPIGLQMLSPIRLQSSELPGVQLISVTDRPISEVALFIKSTFDRVVSTMALIGLLPVLLVCVLGILISDPGPVSFRQVRIGYKGREFTIYKFRTMRVNHAGVAGLTRRDDPRVFRFGHFLRRTSLDELPQLLNVLMGDMSLIGPRPHLQTARAAGMLYFEAANEYAARHRVKPGITGWAQVHGWRGPTETVEQIEKRVEHDIYYIENWSLLLDFIILVKTVLSGFIGKNAF
jgi:Undecaprenyl-phosphate glucose phosphotransferase